MLHEIDTFHHVVVSSKNVDQNGDVRGSTIVNNLLKDISKIKATKSGYFLAITKLKSIGLAHRQESYFCFHVDFSCRVFKPVDGEILVGVVSKMTSRGVFLNCGPMNMVFLSLRLMPNYYYVAGEHPVFLKDDLSKIDIDVVIRFKVFAVRWVEDAWRQFRVLATIDGESLGPVSSAQGLDGLDL